MRPSEAEVGEGAVFDAATPGLLVGDAVQCAQVDTLGDEVGAREVDGAVGDGRRCCPPIPRVGFRSRGWGPDGLLKETPIDPSP